MIRACFRASLGLFGLYPDPAQPCRYRIHWDLGAITSEINRNFKCQLDPDDATGTNLAANLKSEWHS